VNIGTAAICLPLVLCVGGWFARRVWWALARVRNGEAAIARRKKVLLYIMCTELALHAINLSCFLASNIYAIVVGLHVGLTVSADGAGELNRVASVSVCSGIGSCAYDAAVA